MVFVLVIAFFLPTRCLADNYYYTYGLLDDDGDFEKYSLEVSVTSSLYEYYRSKEHNFQLIDFGKFITPSALKPIADDLLSIYSNAEHFANGVLMIVHQIPYREIGPEKYPVETIVENEGDCDLFSFIAASILMAGGVDTVLLFYETQNQLIENYVLHCDNIRTTTK